MVEAEVGMVLSGLMKGLLGKEHWHSESCKRQGVIFSGVSEEFSLDNILILTKSTSDLQNCKIIHLHSFKRL